MPRVARTEWVHLPEADLDSSVLLFTDNDEPIRGFETEADDQGWYWFYVYSPMTGEMRMVRDNVGWF